VPDDPLNLAEFSCAKRGIQFHGEQRRNAFAASCRDSSLSLYESLTLLAFIQRSLVIPIVAFRRCMYTATREK